MQFVVLGPAVDDALDPVTHMRLEVRVSAMDQHPLTLKGREARETWGLVLKSESQKGSIRGRGEKENISLEVPPRERTEISMPGD